MHPTMHILASDHKGYGFASAQRYTPRFQCQGWELGNSVRTRGDCSNKTVTPLMPIFGQGFKCWLSHVANL